MSTGAGWSGSPEKLKLPSRPSTRRRSKSSLSTLLSAPVYQGAAWRRLTAQVQVKTRSAITPFQIIYFVLQFRDVTNENRILNYLFVEMTAKLFADARQSQILSRSVLLSIGLHKVVYGQREVVLVRIIITDPVLERQLISLVISRLTPHPPSLYCSALSIKAPGAFSTCKSVLNILDSRTNTH